MGFLSVSARSAEYLSHLVFTGGNHGAWLWTHVEQGASNNQRSQHYPSPRGVPGLWTTLCIVTHHWYKRVQTDGSCDSIEGRLHGNLSAYRVTHCIFLIPLQTLSEQEQALLAFDTPSVQGHPSFSTHGLLHSEALRIHENDSWSAWFKEFFATFAYGSAFTAAFLLLFLLVTLIFNIRSTLRAQKTYSAQKAFIPQMEAIQQKEKLGEGHTFKRTIRQCIKDAFMNKFCCQPRKVRHPLRFAV